jgi:hypothetical protein
MNELRSSVSQNYFGFATIGLALLTFWLVESSWVWHLYVFFCLRIVNQDSALQYVCLGQALLSSFYLREQVYKHCCRCVCVCVSLIWYQIFYFTPQTSTEAKPLLGS